MKPTAWASDLLDLLLPAGCVACRSWIPGGGDAPLVCARCRSRLREAAWPRCPRCHHPRGSGRPEAERCPECEAWPDALTAARYAYVLGTPSDDLVHALKYEGWSELADVMGDAVARQVAMLTVPQREARVIVPVPTTAERLRSRGYNQAELLARRVARVCRLRLEVGLVRTGARASQTALTPHERRENVRGAFRPAPGAHRIRGARVVLVDD
ncbi:MAG: double zinc ribbon domain-containing protein, partial [Gemmatimonadota bacterium]